MKGVTFYILLMVYLSGSLVECKKCSKTQCEFNKKCYNAGKVVEEYSHACAYLKCVAGKKKSSLKFNAEADCSCSLYDYTSAKRSIRSLLTRSSSSDNKISKISSRLKKVGKRAGKAQKCKFNNKQLKRNQVAASLPDNYISLKCSKFKGKRSFIQPQLDVGAKCSRNGASAGNPYFVPGEDTSPHPCDAIDPTNSAEFDSWLSNAVAKKVVIVGGGVSGLKAAETLDASGVTDYVILEAQDRVGGRVKTFKQGNIVVEEGAEWINGGSDNLLYGIASDLNLLSELRPDNQWEWKMRNTNGGTPEKLGLRYDKVERLETNIWTNSMSAYHLKSLGHVYTDKFPGAYGSDYGTTVGQAWLYYLQQRINIEIGTADWFDISALDADNYQELGSEEEGDKYQWARGYEAIVDYLKGNVNGNNIELNTPVCYVDYDMDGDKVLVVTSSGASYLADYALVTASAGHLKENYQDLFYPTLPASFGTALGYINMGTVNKVQLGWPTKWWNNDAISLEILWEVRDLPEEMEWMYSIMEFFSVRGNEPVLQCFVTSSGSEVFESLDDDTVHDHVMFLLRKLIPKTTVPDPTFFNRSLWRLNKWVRGSYNSFITPAGVNAGMTNREDLRNPVINKNGKKVIFFGGEHTHDTRYSTVDGAIQTGEWAANNIMQQMRK